MTAIALMKNISQKFKIGNDEVLAVKDVDLEIQQGEFISIVGPSGSGKSTLLNLLGGLSKPTSGEIMVKGFQLTKMNENELSIFRRKHVGFIFQSYNLLPNLTTQENVALPLIFSGVPPKERLKKSIEILEVVGLSHRLDHKPTELSGGQQQRVSIARALVNNPEIVLADEPTGNLDTITSEEIMQLFTLLNRERRCTIILVTHDLEAAKYGNKTIYFRDGKIEEVV
ncbi:ABC transporter ATP-binding protein [Caldalkalibacillus mannanilyticus]|uniref:ABC transporter ATP-binding protein n=1 Tax=Caldalkalibacillus mannanilyticus TaxID=1418 RepID=UPI0004686F24|nr:ABC transporter ATP-binding protein [Caldalkalibacillus mannanilyticus]